MWKNLKRNSFDCQYPKIELVRPEITLKGLEYLEENSMMKKVSKAAGGYRYFYIKINMVIKHFAIAGCFFHAQTR